MTVGGVGGWAGLAAAGKRIRIEVGAVRWRKEGWVSLRATAPNATVQTVPMAALAGARCGAGSSIGGSVNLRGSAVVEVLDAQGSPIVGFSGAAAARVTGDEVAASLCFGHAGRRTRALPSGAASEGVAFRVRMADEGSELFGLSLRCVPIKTDDGRAATAGRGGNASCLRVATCPDPMQCPAGRGNLSAGVLIPLGPHSQRPGSGLMQWQAAAQRASVLFLALGNASRPGDPYVEVGETLHTTLLYLCCLHSHELDAALELLERRRWALLSGLRFDKAVCVRAVSSTAKTNIVVTYEPGSERRLQALAALVEQELRNASISILVPPDSHRGAAVEPPHVGWYFQREGGRGEKASQMKILTVPPMGRCRGAARCLSTARWSRSRTRRWSSSLSARRLPLSTPPSGRGAGLLMGLACRKSAATGRSRGDGALFIRPPTTLPDDCTGVPELASRRRRALPLPPAVESPQSQRLRVRRMYLVRSAFDKSLHAAQWPPPRHQAFNNQLIHPAHQPHSFSQLQAALVTPGRLERYFTRWWRRREHGSRWS